MSHLRRRWPRAARAFSLAALVFAGLFLVYTRAEAPLPTWDAYGTIFPALSLLNDGDLSLAPPEIPFLFQWRMPETGRRLQLSIWDRMIIDGQPANELYRAGKLRADGTPYYFITRAPGGEYVSTFGPGAAVVTAPFFAAMTFPDAAVRLRNVVPLIERSGLVAAALTAATAVILLLTSLRYLSPLRALLVATIFGLGSCAWSLGSQALWAQTALQPFLALGIDQFLRVRDRRAFALTAGLALGCAVCVRSVTALVLVAVGLHLLVTDRKALALCVVGALPPLALLAAYNARHFGSPSVEAHVLVGTAIALGKTGSSDLWSTPLWRGALGLLISPARGLLVYSPILLLSFVGAYRVREEQWRAFWPIAAAAAVVMVTRFKWFDWWGGYSYGYRPLMDAIVPLVILVIPAIGTDRHGAAWRVAVGVMLAWSVGVQWIGTAYDSGGWDAPTYFQVRAPDGTTSDLADRQQAAELARQNGGRVTSVVHSIDDPRYRDRLWSIADNPIAYYYRHRGEALARRNASLDTFTKGPVEMRHAGP